MKIPMGWLLLWAMAAFATMPQGDPKKGKELFNRRCTGCHQLDQIRVGPRMRGVFGRVAASDPGFPYSEALKSARITWNESALDRWLADTEAVVPDNDMAFRVPSADERAALIAYLRSLSPQ